MRTLSLLLLSGLLVACSNDEQSASIPASWSPSAGLTYAYPYNGQTRIAPSAPIVLHFSAPVQPAGSASLAASFSLRDAGNNPVAFTLTQTDENRGVVLTPTSALSEKQSYTVTWSDLAATDGQIAPVALSFSTRPAYKGNKSAISTSGTFQVDRSLPVQADLPFMDFSTLRLQFSQPIDQKTLSYGQTVRLENANGDLVPAAVLANAQMLSIDPKQDLVAGASYHLKLTAGLKSTLGTALTPGSYADRTLTPGNSGPRATMAMSVPDSASGSLVSPLTGAAINNVPIASRLLGSTGASQQAGNLYAELAYVPRFPDATPITIRRGNMLTGSSVDVKIVGQVPAGLNTGAIRVNIISDANGYMVANPYSKAIDAPRLVYLAMDSAMTADSASANGALTQNLLHTEVVGTAIVKNGKLTMDAVGVAELDVMGLDQASGIFSFHIEGYTDQATAPAQAQDTQAPTLQSWLPGNEAKRARPDDPVILTFSEPLTPDSVTSSSLKLKKDGSEEPINWRMDGASLVIRPVNGLAHNANYSVELSTNNLSTALTDLAGNGLAASTLSFRLPDLGSPNSRSPIVLATTPGFPCVTTGRNASAGLQGRCLGGKSDDDSLPIPTLAKDRSIQVQFSQNMNAASIKLGIACNASSFRVERIDNSGVCQGVVAGQLEVGQQTLRFTPDDAWSEGQLYRYVLNSNGNSQSTTATCDGAQALCGSNGLPLQTQALAQTAGTAPTATGGGPAMEIWFLAGALASTTGQRLLGLPGSDVNVNFVHDSDEDGPVDTGGGVYQAPNAARVITNGQGGMIQGSNTGCDVGETCPTKQFIYMSNALDAEVANYSAGDDAVQVLIQPSQIISTGFDTYVDAGLFGKTTAPTGPQIMRIRYVLNPANSRRELPITGYLRNVGGALQMSATLDAYLDAPSLDPRLQGVPIAHNLHSLALSGVAVSGPVSFLPDGRMLAKLSNVSDVDFTVVLDGTAGLIGIGPKTGTINLRIPQGTMQMEGVALPMKQ